MTHDKIEHFNIIIMDIYKQSFLSKKNYLVNFKNICQESAIEPSYDIYFEGCFKQAPQYKYYECGKKVSVDQFQYLMLNIK